MKKAVTTFGKISNKKFDFDKQIENFNNWEKRKKEKLERLKKQK